MSLYYQYGTAPNAMQSPDYQTFLKLLETWRQQNGTDSTGKSSSQQSGQGMQGMGQLMKMFGGGAPSVAGATPMSSDSFDSGGGMGGISGIAGMLA